MHPEAMRRFSFVSAFPSPLCGNRLQEESYPAVELISFCTTPLLYNNTFLCFSDCVFIRISISMNRLDCGKVIPSYG
jgi:hypothetical protein